MKLYSQDKDYKLYQGSMLDMLKVIEPNSIDAIVTDPPYELGFMGKGWDSSGIAFQKETWVKCYDVLKSGGYLLAFGGTRTFHRIACAIEDAGFEIRDTIMWLYGSGFPKSLNVGLAIDKKNGVESKVVGYTNTPDLQDIGIKQKKLGNGHIQSFGQISNAERLNYEIKEAQNEWNGWGTQLKPAYEPIIVARKPIENSITENVMKYGVGALNIDECRVGNEEMKAQVSGKTSRAYQSETTTTAGGKGIDHIGRYPANVILTYDETDKQEVCGGMPETPIGNGKVILNGEVNRVENGDIFCYGFHNPDKINTYNDGGSASRYFYCAKASSKDRDEGLDGFESEKVNDGRIAEVDNPYQGGETLRKNIHPTVKPTELMQYLVRLVAPKGATILDCFNGSGSTGKAVMWENKEREANYKYIGIELTEEYLPIAKARIEYVKKADNVYYETTDFEENQERKVVKRQLTIDEFLLEE